MTTEAIDPEVSEWMSERYDDLLVSTRPSRFTVGDELFEKLLAEADRNTDLLGYGLARYRDVLLFNRIPVHRAGPTGEGCDDP